jgi:hypothetical protein
MKERIIIKAQFFTERLTRVLIAIGTILLVVGVASMGTIQEYSLIVIGLALFVYILAFFFGKAMKKRQLVVTDKRIYGQVAFGKRIDLPYDSISAVGTCFPKGVFASTSSGAVKFLLISNQADIYNQISNLLKVRQAHSYEKTSASPSLSNADELKKFKELLDMDIITQEEFDAKKKELLGL